jgi:serine/threonine protein kinase
MERSALPEPGDFVGGKYRVERVLGQGGMGVVFEAAHRVTGKRFAIKWLLSDPAPGEDSVARFVREAQVAGRCEHHHITEVYDIDREGSTLFMVMELLKGESLADRLSRQGRMSPPEACRLLLPCIEAIADVHAAGIIHRDLKPANIFICQARGREPELAKVLDFGVSRFAANQDDFAGTKTKSGAVVGTPFYMAPEQMRSQPIDVRVDVYSMGVTLYEVLAGTRPYHADSYGDLLLKLAEAKPAPLPQLVRDLPRGLGEIVERAMAYDRAARFANMQELAQALEPYLTQSLPPLHPISGSQLRIPLSEDSGATPWASEARRILPEPTPAPQPRAKRRSKLWLASAVLALGVAGVVGWLSWPAPRPQTADMVPPAVATSPIVVPPTEDPKLPDEAPRATETSVSAAQTDEAVQPAAAQPPAASLVDSGVQLPNAVPVAEHPAGRRQHGPRPNSPAAAPGEPSDDEAPAPAANPEERVRERARPTPSAAPPSPQVPPAESHTRPRNRAPAVLDRSDF